MYQFEWIAIEVDSSNKTLHQNEGSYFHQFEWIPMIHNSICGMIDSQFNMWNDCGDSSFPAPFFS